MRGVKAVLFDVFGTVVDWRGSLIAELGAFGARRGIAADWAGLVDAWLGAYQPSMQRVRSGALPWTVLDDLHRASLDELIARFAIAGLDDADRAWMVAGWHRLKPWPDTVAGLDALKQRAIIGTLSNGNVALLVNLAKAGGMAWDVVFGADIFGHYKPDPETYLGACRLLRLAPHEVMLAAAHNSDLAAARALGLRTGFIPRPGEYGPAQARDLRAEAAWDIVAEDIPRLAAAVASG